MTVLAKVADIGHAYAKWDTHLRWSKALENEMFIQGDMEAEAGIQVSPLMDRNRPGCSYPENQIGFFDVIVLPFLKELSHVFPAVSCCLTSAQHNRSIWQDRVMITRSSVFALEK